MKMTSKRPTCVAAFCLMVFAAGSMHAASDLPVTSGLVLHLNASDPNNDGGATLPSEGEGLAAWRDTSGAGNDAVGRTGNPSWHADGGPTFSHQPVFRFDGDDAYLIGTASGTDPLGVHGTNEATIITVINPKGNTLDGNTRWFGNTGGSDDYFGQTHGGNSGTLPTGAAGTDLVSGYGADGPSSISGVNERHILISVFSRTLRVMYDNGVAGTSDTTDWGATTTISCPSPKAVGAFMGNTQPDFFYAGDIAEVAVFNRALSSSEITQIQNHLDAKYQPQTPASDLPVTSGLVLHLNASDPNFDGGDTLPSSGAAPAAWSDTSGASNDAGAGAGSPNWYANGGSVLNYQPVFRFDGNDAYLVGPTANVDPLGVHGGAAATIVTVINPRSNALDGNTRWFGNTGGTSDFFGQNHGAASGTLPSGGAGTSLSTVYGASGPSNISGVNERHILISVLSRNVRVLYDNGVPGASNTVDWGASTTISCNSQKGVGAFESSGSISSSTFYSGDIAEVAVYDRALSGSEVSQVQAHLDAKYAPVPPATALPITDGLVLHLDASDPLNNGGTTLPFDGSTPASWRDTSSGAHDTTGLEGNPSWIADGGAAWNNRPVFRFDGDDAFRIGDDGNIDPLGLHGVATEVTIITVLNRQGNVVNNNTRWFGQTTTVAFGHYANTDGSGYATVATDLGGGAIGGTGALQATTSHILVSTHSRLLRRFYNNGVLENSSTTDWGAGATLNTPAPKGVGAFANTGSLHLSQHYTGDIAEVLVFDRVPTDWELDRIGFYLQTKYGIDGAYQGPQGSLFMLR